MNMIVGSMLTGIYSARFTSLNDLVGAGVAVLDGTALHGGGFEHLIKGNTGVPTTIVLSLPLT